MSALYSAFAAIVATLAFTLFDLWLFPRAAERGLLVWYRIAQVALQIGLYGAAWYITDWTAAVAAGVIWWTGGCDVLFYWLGKYAWWSSIWSWLWWTPAGLWRWIPAFIKASGPVLKRAEVGRDAVTIDGCGVLWQAGIGVLLAILLLLL